MPTGRTKLSIASLRHMAAGDEVAEPYLLDLLAMLGDDDDEVNGWISDVLRTVPQPPPELADRLAVECQSPHAGIASWACTLLSQLGKLDSRSQAAIVSVLESHSDVTARQQAAKALANVHNLNEPSIKALQQAAASDDDRLRRLATQAISKVT